MNNLEFVANFSCRTDNNIFVIIIPCVHDKEALLSAYYKQAEFPYFGFNWDALEELLRDFSWVQQEKILIYQDGLLELNGRELSIYMGIVIRTLKWWENYADHVVHYYFNEKEKTKIEELIVQLDIS